MEQTKPNSTDYIQRHLARINEKRQSLENEHFQALSELDELNRKIKQIKHYYGFFKCRFVAYIKHLIQELQSAMFRARKRCEEVLRKLCVLAFQGQFPFV